jgi:hypothetical protein
VFDYLDEADHVEVAGRLAVEFLEVEDAKTIRGPQEVGIGADIVAREFEGAAGERAEFAQILEEAAGAAAEVEPAEAPFRGAGRREKGGGGEGKRGRGGERERGRLRKG